MVFGIAAILSSEEDVGMLRFTQIVCSVSLVVFTSASLPARADSAAAGEAFRKIQDLVGTWEGRDERGTAVKSEFVSVASNTAVMENLSMSGMEEMVTLYSRDIDSIVLVHYCPTNNQPRMRAVPTANPVKRLVFAFTGAGNLPSFSIGHEQRLVLQFTDEDHIIERWTWRKSGKDTEMVFNLARVRVGKPNGRK